MVTNTNVNKTWNNAFLLDIPIIDKQHEKFFSIYDNLVKMLNNKVQTDDDKTKQVLIELKDYLKLHFQTEKQLMVQAGYPGVKQHLKQHEFFEKKTDEFILGYEYGNPLLLNNMVVFTKKWFLSHIMQVDAKFKESVVSFLNQDLSVQ